MVVVLGGVGGARQIKKWVRQAQLQQKLLCHDINGKPKGRMAPRVAVDNRFFKRLLAILSM